jgi:hypothetical protein
LPYGAIAFRRISQSLDTALGHSDGAACQHFTFADVGEGISCVLDFTTDQSHFAGSAEALPALAINHNALN